MGPVPATFMASAVGAPSSSPVNEKKPVTLMLSVGVATNETDTPLVSCAPILPRCVPGPPFVY